jgi:hypothetical protein
VVCSRLAEKRELGDLFFSSPNFPILVLEMAVRAVIVPSYPMLMLPSLPLQSANVRQRAVRLPRASVGHSRKQRSGMVCASGMAESESAGTDESPLPSYFFFLPLSQILS